jgi:voltage-gated potassium channel
MTTANQKGRQPSEWERSQVLLAFERVLERPMLVLAFAWLALLIIELIWGLGPVLAGLGTLIWVIFILDAAVRLILAPNRRVYLKRNWLSVLALALPALRIVRIARLARFLRMTRAARGLRLVRLISLLNRGMQALNASMGRRGFGYVVTLTAIVTLTGAAGMYVFEGLPDYGGALWWTAMIMTTMGSDYWPKTAEGRLLCFFLALYAFAVFGYVTATLASYFVGRDAENKRGEVAGARSIEALTLEIEGLRGELGAVLES